MKLFMLAAGLFAGALLILVASVVAADQAFDNGSSTPAAGHVHEATSATTQPQSYAGVTGTNADELAKAHEPYPALLPPVPAGDVVKVRMVMKHKVVEIAPGVKYNVWAFDGRRAHRARSSTFARGRRSSSRSSTAARFPTRWTSTRRASHPNKAFIDVAPGESFTFRFEANDPGVFMYHCGTKPVLAHIANGMYGAIVVDPATPLPKVDREYVLVASEWYLNADGIAEPASLDMTKARSMTPDWTSFNGYAAQYVTHPLTADPGDLSASTSSTRGRA